MLQHLLCFQSLLRLIKHHEMLGQVWFSYHFQCQSLCQNAFLVNQCYLICSKWTAYPKIKHKISKNNSKKIIQLVRFLFLFGWNITLKPACITGNVAVDMVLDCVLNQSASYKLSAKLKHLASLLLPTLVNMHGLRLGQMSNCFLGSIHIIDWHFEDIYRSLLQI